MMAIQVDEINQATGQIFLDIGAGGFSKKTGFLSVDVLDREGVDLVGDAAEVLGQIEDNKIDGIYTRHFLEHIENVPALIEDMVRVCKNGACIEIIVPHFSNPFYYSDVTHRSLFGLYSFSYMARSEVGMRRRIPTYARVDGLVQTNVKLVFRSYKPRFIRSAIKKMFQFIFNSGTYAKELYEEFFCWMMPCYEISYKLTVEKR